MLPSPRASREMSKRMLRAFSVWKVKGLQHQSLSSVKKRKLAPNLFTEDEELDEAIPKDAESSLDRLFMLCLSYALAGTTSRLRFDSLCDGALRLDMTMMYWFRAKRTAASVPVARRLSWAPGT